MPNVGTAPYEESAFKAALRLLGGGLRGLGAVPEGANFGLGLGAGFAASSRASDAARQAAQEYAMKREGQQRQSEMDALNQQYIEAQIEKMKRPSKPEKIDLWNLDADERTRYLKYLEDVERAKGAGRPVKTAKPKVPPKTVEQRGSEQIQIAGMKRREKEAQGLYETNDPADLLRASKDMQFLPETRNGAWAKYLRLTRPGNPRQIP